MAPILFGLSATLAAIILMIPSRRNGALRRRLGLADPVSRHAACAATRRCVRAYWHTSRAGRRVFVPVAAVCWPISHQLARWAPGSALVVDANASVRILARRGRWLLVDAAAWPVGTGQARRLLAKLCASADRCGVTMALLAANSAMATKVYVPLGFRPIRAGGRRYVRLPAARPSEVCPTCSGDAVPPAHPGVD